MRKVLGDATCWFLQRLKSYQNLLKLRECGNVNNYQLKEKGRRITSISLITGLEWSEIIKSTNKNPPIRFARIGSNTDVTVTAFPPVTQFHVSEHQVNMSVLKVTCIIFCSLLLKGVASYRILAFMPYGSHSHKNTLTPLLRGLAQRNHSVTFITNERSPVLDDCPTVEQVVIDDLAFSLMGPEESTDFFQVAAKPSIHYQWKIFKHMSGIIGDVINKTYSTPRVQQMLSHDHYDLLLLSQVRTSWLVSIWSHVMPHSLAQLTT